jgi:alkylation response protein AidB-like acyl-CoA dehydrogenase
MADLCLNDEQKEYQQLAFNFCQKEIIPHIHSFEEQNKPAIDIYKTAWQLGLMNVTIPEQYGGPGFKNYEACLIVEEIASGCTGISASFEANHAFISLVLLAGNDKQKETYFNSLTSEFSLAGYSLIPPSEIETESYPITYKRNKNNYVLNGAAPVLNASAGKWIYVLGKNIENNDFSPFIIPTSINGYLAQDKVTTLGRKTADLKSVSFKNIELDNTYLIGKESEGLIISKQLQTVISPYIAAQATGLAKSALHHSITYAKERKTFGQAIANYQAISFMLADMAKNIEASRLLYRKAAWLIDNNEPSLYHSLVSQSFATDAAVKIAIDAVQIFGGYGYSREYPVEKLMRDSKVLETQCNKANDLLGKCYVTA